MDPAPLVDTLKPTEPVKPAAPASATPPNPATPDKPAASADGLPAPTATTKPDWASDDLWDAEKNVLKTDDLGKRFKELSEFKTTAEARLADVPKEAKDYEFSISPDLKLPDGVAPDTLKVDEKNPLLASFRELAKEEGLTKAGANKLYNAFVQHEVGKATAINARAAEERTALGADAPARVTAIETFLTSHLGEDAAKPMMRGVFTAAQVKGFEALMQKFQGGNIVPFNAKNPTGADDPGKIPGFDTMSFEQRRAAQDASARK